MHFYLSMNEFRSANTGSEQKICDSILCDLLVFMSSASSNIHDKTSVTFMRTEVLQKQVKIKLISFEFFTNPRGIFINSGHLQVGEVLYFKFKKEDFSQWQHQTVLAFVARSADQGFLLCDHHFIVIASDLPFWHLLSAQYYTKLATNHALHTFNVCWQHLI